MNKKNTIIALFACCVFAIVASFIASSHPDGLEWVASKLNFAGAGEGKEVIKSLMPDYAVPAIKSPFLSSAAAAVAGTVVMFAVVYIVGRILRKKER